MTETQMSPEEAADHIYYKTMDCVETLRYSTYLVPGDILKIIQAQRDAAVADLEQKFSRVCSDRDVFIEKCSDLQAKNEALEREVERINKTADQVEAMLIRRISHYQQENKTLEAQAAAMRLAITEITEIVAQFDYDQESYFDRFGEKPINQAIRTLVSKAWANPAGKELLEENQRLRKVLKQCNRALNFPWGERVTEEREKSLKEAFYTSQEALQGKGE